MPAEMSEHPSRDADVFASQVAGDDGSVFVKLVDGAKPATALVVFGGISGAFGVPPFEFVRLSGELDTNVVFIRDRTQRWYQAGVPELGGDVRTAVEGLGRRLDELGLSRVVCVGNSAGGFAASVFGSLLGAVEVHAFVPQTTLLRRHRVVMLDRRWRSHMRATRRAARASSDPASDALDLTRLLGGNTVPLHVHYSETSRLDRAHARRMGRVPSCTLHAYDAGGHGLVKMLRDDGRLLTILEGAVARL